MMDVDEIITLLNLRPLQGEGGLYAETYRSNAEIPSEALPPGYPSPRPFGTAIYYLLTSATDSFSALHRLKGDEIYHFYLGDPVEMLLLFHDGSARTVILGQELRSGQQVQWVVPGGTWQGSRLRVGGRYALLGTTMAPGFDFADFEAGERGMLSVMYPEQTLEITRLTRT